MTRYTETIGWDLRVMVRVLDQGLWSSFRCRGSMFEVRV